jgi:hypothetical protein
MTTYLNYKINDDNLLNQLSSNFYTLNDPSINFVFEFLPMDISTNIRVVPLFQTFDQTNLGFIPVNATAIIDVSANNFSKLFKFNSNDITFDDYPNQDIRYGVENQTPFNIPFSKATVISGWANPATPFLSNTSIAADYIRKLAKDITGGYALADIFSNQTEIVNGIVNLDASLNQILNQKITTNYTTYAYNGGMLTYPDNSNNIFTTSCKQLLDGLLSRAGTTRGLQFLNDLSQQSYNNLMNTGLNADDETTFYIKFEPGDILAVRIAYVPKNGDGVPAGNPGNYLGTNLLFTRSYKVFLRMT